MIRPEPNNAHTPFLLVESIGLHLFSATLRLPNRGWSTTTMMLAKILSASWVRVYWTRFARDLSLP